MTNNNTDTKTNAISTVEYKYEWNDHLHMLYADFTTRNDIREWVYFLRRPELADPELSEEIAVTVLRYITQFGHITLEIIRYVENFFNYLDHREKYEKKVGYEAIELYQAHQVMVPEFPPYKQFGEYDSDKDYDSYIHKFNEIYFELTPENIEEYKNHLDELNAFGIEHPYFALLESQLYAMGGAWQQAASCLKEMEDGYHRKKHMGFILFSMGEYEQAEECYSAAMEEKAGMQDVTVMGDYIMCKWQTRRYLEALETANKFIDMGYEFSILPIKQGMLSEMTKLLLKKGEEYELSEEEMLIIKEYYKQYGDYQTVMKLGELSWKKGYVDGSWTVDMTEAYFEVGEYEKAQQVIDMVSDGRKVLSMYHQMKIREVKARLLFEQNKIAEAYEIMENLCGRPGSTMRQKFVLAKMYMTTGNNEAAMDILRHLRLYSGYNLSYSYELGRCMMEEGEYEYAHYLFTEVFNADPEFEQAAFYMIEAAIDRGLTAQAPSELKEASKYLTDYEKRYLEGEIEEMKGNFKAAKEIYKNLINDHTEGLYPEKLLYDTCVRFFLMKEETNVPIKTFIKEVQNALTKLPEADALWVYLAEFHERIGSETKDYEKCYKYALKANRFNKTALMNLLVIYSQQEKWDLAWQLCSTVITYTGWNEAYYFRANQGLEMGKYEQCIKDIDHYEAHGGDPNKCHITRQQLAMRKSDYTEAIKHIEARLENRKVSEVPCYDDMAICLCKLGKWQEAAELMDIVCETSKYPVFHGILYQIQKYNGDFKGAKETLKRYKKLCNVGLLDDEYTLLQVKLMLDSGSGMAAQTVAESIASTDGERFCAVLELLYGSKRNAIRLFNKLIKREPGEVENYIWCALTLKMIGKEKEAAELAGYGFKAFEKAYGKIEITTRPNRVYQYGMLKMLAGEAATARKLFEKAAQLPTCPEFVCTGCYKAHCGLGLLYALNGYKNEAENEFNKSLKIRPNNAVCKKLRDKLLK